MKLPEKDPVPPHLAETSREYLDAMTTFIHGQFFALMKDPRLKTSREVGVCLRATAGHLGWLVNSLAVTMTRTTKSANAERLVELYKQFRDMKEVQDSAAAQKQAEELMQVLDALEGK